MGKIYSCKNCLPPVRHIGCHSTCEKYLNEKEEQERLKKLNKDALLGVTINSNGTFYHGKSPRRRHY